MGEPAFGRVDSETVGETFVNYVDVDAATGEEELKAISKKLHGGGLKGRASFISVLLRRRGNVIIKVMPVSLLGTLLASILVYLKDDQMQSGDPEKWEFILPELGHPFVVQIFGIVQAFVVVARCNIATHRYFKGMNYVHLMSNRWIDAYTSLLGFLRASSDQHPAGSPKQDACVALSLAMLHWGTLAHALAINSLQVTQLGLDEKIWENRISILNPPENLTLEAGRDYEAAAKTIQTHRSRAQMIKGAMSGDRRVSLTGGEGVDKPNTKFTRDLARLGVMGTPSKEEVARLHGATDKVAIVLMWMEEAISRAQVQGIILVGPPILGRVYCELGNGLIGFNNAYRIALVPFPFCFSQMIGWCLVIFLFLCPAVSYVFTGGQALTSSLTFACLVGFWGLNRIAMELENPYGCEVNHLPMGELHHAFVEAIGEMYHHPMPEYAWERDAGTGKTYPQLRRNMTFKLNV